MNQEQSLLLPQEIIESPIGLVLNNTIIKHSGAFTALAMIRAIAAGMSFIGSKMRNTSITELRYKSETPLCITFLRHGACLWQSFSASCFNSYDYIISPNYFRKSTRGFRRNYKKILDSGINLYNSDELNAGKTTQENRIFEAIKL